MILIEVVAALALLGTTIVAILVVRSRSLVQLQTAGDRLQAAHLARELIADWRLRQTNVTRDDRGEFESEPGPGLGPGWSWRRSVSSVVVAGSVEMKLITLDIVCRDGSNEVVASYPWLEEP
jgi:Tfp pilus assembly protein PilV